MSEYMKHNGPKLLHGFLLTTIGALIGFAVSQITVVAQVSRHDTEIVQFRREFEGEKNRTDQRIYVLVGLVERTIEQNKEFVSLIKVQTEVLRASYNKTP